MAVVGSEEDQNALNTRLLAEDSWRMAFNVWDQRPYWYFAVLAHLQLLLADAPIRYLTSNLEEETQITGRILAFTDATMVEVTFTVQSDEHAEIASKVTSNKEITTVSIVRVALNRSSHFRAEGSTVKAQVLLSDGREIQLPLGTRGEDVHEFIPSLISHVVA